MPSAADAHYSQHCRQHVPLEGNLNVLTCNWPIFGAALLVIGCSLLAWSPRAGLCRCLPVAGLGRAHLQAVNPSGCADALSSLASREHLSGQWHVHTLYATQAS